MNRYSKKNYIYKWQEIKKCEVFKLLDILTFMGLADNKLAAISIKNSWKKRIM